MAQKLTGEARKAALARLKGWSEVNGRDAISRKFIFADFNEAFGFMARSRRRLRSSTTTRMVECLQDRRGDPLHP